MFRLNTVTEQYSSGGSPQILKIKYYYYSVATLLQGKVLHMLKVPKVKVLIIQCGLYWTEAFQWFLCHNSVFGDVDSKVWIKLFKWAASAAIQQYYQLHLIIPVYFYLG